MPILAVFLIGAPARFQISENHLKDFKVEPSGANDRAKLKGRIPWCKGPYEGETTWDEFRLYRTINAANSYTTAEAALALCESPEEPTWIQLAEKLLQKVINEYDVTQDEALAKIDKAIAKRAKAKANEGKEPTDEERFAFSEEQLVEVKPAPGVETVKLDKLSWCEGVTVTNRREIRDIVSWMRSGDSSEIAWQLCQRPTDPTWLQMGNLLVQKVVNRTGMSTVDAIRSLKARMRPDKWKEEREALCAQLKVGPEVTGAEKAFGVSQQMFFGCTTHQNYPLWELRDNTPENLTFYVDPLVNAPNPIVHMVMLFQMVRGPRDKVFPGKTAYDNTEMLWYAVAQQDFAALDRAAADKMLAAAPYNEYARVVAFETITLLKNWQKTYEAAIDKMTKGDADVASVLRAAPKKGWAAWAKVSAQWKNEIARSNAFELKLSNPSRKVLKGCQTELMPDVRKLVKSYKLSDYNDVKSRLQEDPVAILLFGRLAVCTAYEKVPSVPGVLEELVRGGRDLRGPRSMAYYAVVDALSEALKDRPKMLLQHANFYWTGSGDLVSMYKREMTFSGGLGQGPERAEPRGIVASIGKGKDGLEIKFKQTSYSYPEQDCRDNKSHPLKIDSGGHIHYAQICKYTGKTITENTTPRPITVPSEMATNVKPGVYIVASEQGKGGVVYFTKTSSKDKKIGTFYGFDL